jgi:predicted outer membrane protein
MKEQVAAYLANLVQMGLSRSRINEKAYDYAIALQLEHEEKGSQVTAAMMEQAVELVKAAWTTLPLIPRFYEKKR